MKYMVYRGISATAVLKCHLIEKNKTEHFKYENAVKVMGEN